MNKKGAELTIGTIVIIVLALVVLVVLILGFTSGWGNLWGRISGFFGSESNIDSVVQACQVVCTTQSQNDWCVRQRTVKADTEVFVVDTDGVIQVSIGTSAKEGKETCKFLAENHGALGFQDCPGLCPE